MNRSSFALASLALFLLAGVPSPHASASMLDQEVCLGDPDMQEDILGLRYEAYWPSSLPGADGGLDSNRLLPEPNFRQPGLPADASLEARVQDDCLTTKSEVDLPGEWAVDANGDGMGDGWVADIVAKTGAAVTKLGDLDGDGLTNVREFQWRLVPICHAAMGQNCMDRESSPASGAGGDSWQDGAEVWFWNDPSNDDEGLYAGKAFYDPDAGRDTDGDGQVDTRDADTDNDGLTDGVEVVTYGTYPHVVDSDCGYAPCTSSTNTRAVGPHSGNPGTGDGIQDNAELVAWNAIGASAWSTNYDGDTYPNNLLDRDADNDGLTDGEEFLSPGSQAVVTDSDTDNDGVLDGNEDAWNTDTDGDGLRSVADTDSDNDAMPDAWEKQWGFNMVNAADAALDRDGDGLSNLGEYQHATNPSDMDSENDLLLDGEEVHTYNTNPLHWDSDGDGMPDSYEAERGFDPLDSVDAGQDADGDSFDQDWDGTPELVWSNLKEYRYGRSASYNEATSGPWMQGTDSLNPDSDNDGAWDGYEAYYGTDPHSFLSGDSDQDDDGLNFTQEIRRNSNPTDADTDNDGLCDGGRSPSCFFPGLGSVGNQPGERDYGSNPWTTDSDLDGLPDSTPAATGEAQLWDPTASGSAQDVDGDLLNGVIDADSDNDGLRDGAERDTYNTDMRVTDSDSDGLLDGVEVTDYLTSPTHPDHDVDGLRDGAEVLVHHTRPTVFDTDGDSLGDGAEINTHGTDPLLRDTDQDQVPDGWEVQKGTQALVPDADVDADADELSNYREFVIGTHPNDSDSENDGLPDGYEDRYALGATTYNPSMDADSDGLWNLNEFNKKTNPRVADTDGDGLNDGAEVNTHATDPLAQDTDADGLVDGAEKAAWDAGSYALSDTSDADSFTALQDPDSDDDGLNDRDELLDAKTSPRVADTDGDTLSDFEEVVTYGGRFNPRDADTDDDGQNDSFEASLLNPDNDTDQDGIKNGEETGTYATDPAEPDSDCDGVQDGPELNYWQASWNVNSVNRLLTADVDGDTLKDGVELGTVGTPSQALYRTLPYVADSDGDGLNDNAEAQNNVRVACDEPQGAEAQQSSSTFIGPAPPSMPLPVVGPSGLVFMQDAVGWYLRGGYGVRLYLVNASVEDFMQPQAGGAPGVGKDGVGTDPQLPDTDGDGLSDGQEVSGSQNPYGGAATDPIGCDSDRDGLGDGLELGVGADAAHKPRQDTSAVCQQRDADTSNPRSNPKSDDTDGDSLKDLTEDPNRNGKLDATDGYVLKQSIPASEGAESGVVDGDTDDDGIRDDLEFGEDRLKWDRDGDGLSDGLETGVKTHVILNGIDYTVPRNVLGLADWPTYQEFMGTYTNNNPDFPVTTPVGDSDQDDDGLVDGLEDLNHNGKWSAADVDAGGNLVPNPSGATELHPNDADFDDDGLSDGLELRIWSKSFADVVGSPGWTFGQLTFDGTAGSALFNPFETNPRSANTDGDEALLDGKDINPRANAFFDLGFGTNLGCPNAFAFQTYETSDNWDSWSPDLTFEVTVGFLGAQSYVSLNFLNDIYSKQMTRLPPDAGEYIPIDANNPAWALGQTKSQLDDALDIPRIHFDLPDDVTKLNSNNLQATITLAIRAYDRDDWTGGDNDMIDFKPGRDSDGTNWEDREIRREINLMDEVTGGITLAGSDPFMGANTYTFSRTDESHNDGAVRYGDIAAGLGFSVSDNAPTYFLSNALSGTPLQPAMPPTGTSVCRGTGDCL